MGDKLRQDATSSIVGTLYQFYIAVDKCFKLIEDEKVIIEKYGDVTISDQLQIEVKHYKEDLTDLHENIWKTLDNWLEDEFDASHYKNLILLTTQSFSVRSSFKDWNNKSKVEKKQILDDVSNKYSMRKTKDQATEKTLSSVQDTTKQTKLLEILDKFIILDSSADDSTYFENLKQEHGKAILAANRDDYINALMGYILSPDVSIGHSWEITYDMFTSKVESLVKQYSSGTIIFPKKIKQVELTEDDEKVYSEHLFVKKIEDIDYATVRSEAISDYVRTQNIIIDELSKYALSKQVYDNYEEGIKRSYSSKYRESSLATNSSNQIKDSKKFYEKITGEYAPNFIHFNDTPIYFKNGLLHGMANDEEKNITWKLKVDDE